MNRQSIYLLIDQERAEQERKWSGPHRWGMGSCASLEVPAIVPAIVKSSVLAEECGEVARAVLDGSEGLKTELVQAAAVCVAWLETLP